MLLLQTEFAESGILDALGVEEEGTLRVCAAGQDVIGADGVIADTVGFGWLGGFDVRLIDSIEAFVRPGVDLRKALWSEYGTFESSNTSRELNSARTLPFPLRIRL